MSARHLFVAALTMLVLAANGTGHAAAAVPADARFDERVLGDPKAPVRIDEYASLACPHCAEFMNEEFPQLKAQYIDTGKVKLVFHDLPIWSIAAKAAMLARCVPADHFFPFVETLFRLQSSWASQQGDAAQLAAVRQQARFAGLSDAQADACLADKTLENWVLQEQVDAGNPPFNVDSTPTFILNGDPKNKLGNVPFATMKTKIDSLLASK